jgi:hypothetical protein
VLSHYDQLSWYYVAHTERKLIMCEESKFNLIDGLFAGTLDATFNFVGGLVMGAASGVVHLATAVVTTRVGRRVLVAGAAATGLYLCATTPIVVPLLLPMGLGAWALVSTVTAFVFWRRSRGTRPLLARLVTPRTTPRAVIRPAINPPVPQPVSPVIAIEAERPRFDEVRRFVPKREKVRAS